MDAYSHSLATLMNNLASMPRDSLKKKPVSPDFSSIADDLTSLSLDGEKLTKMLRDTIAPRVDTGIHTTHTHDEYLYRFNVAGVGNVDDITVECDDKLLTVVAQNDSVEYNYSVTLHTDVDIDTGDVLLQHGMLSMVFKKKLPTARRLKIFTPETAHSATSVMPETADCAASMDGHEVTLEDCDSDDT